MQICRVTVTMGTTLLVVVHNLKRHATRGWVGGAYPGSRDASINPISMNVKVLNWRLIKFN